MLIYLVYGVERAFVFVNAEYQTIEISINSIHETPTTEIH